MCPVCVLRVEVSGSGVALQFALQDLEICLANTPSVHLLFVLYCTDYYKRVWRVGEQRGEGLRR